MGVWTRIKLLLNTEVSSALDRAEDPRQVLDYAYNQQQELLITLRRGLVDVATSKQQLEQQATRLQNRIPQLDDQARRAVTAGRDDLARVAIEGNRLAGRPRFVSSHRGRRLPRSRAPPHRSRQGDRRRAFEDQGRGCRRRAGQGDEVMSSTQWHPRGKHLVSPDGKWYWDGVAQEWKATAGPAEKPPARPAQLNAQPPPERGLSSFAGTV